MTSYFLNLCLLIIIFNHLVIFKIVVSQILLSIFVICMVEINIKAHTYLYLINLIQAPVNPDLECNHNFYDLYFLFRIFNYFSLQSIKFYKQFYMDFMRLQLIYIFYLKIILILLCLFLFFIQTQLMRYLIYLFHQLFDIKLLPLNFFKQFIMEILTLYQLIPFYKNFYYCKEFIC